MPRINIEDQIFRDARFLQLVIKLGDHEKAVGAMVLAWSLAQKWFLSPSRKIPLSDWKEQKMNQCIIDVGLAREEDGFVYVCGSDSQFMWLKERSESGRRGGLKTQENFRSTASAKLKQPQASSSYSSSKERNTYAQQAALVYEKFYPRKLGRGEGLKRLKLSSDQDLADFETAVRKYADHVRGKDPKFTKHFPTFVNNWRDWLPSTTTPTPDAAAPSLEEMLHVPPIGDEA